MILQSLNSYYQRLIEEDSGIALAGFAPQGVGFALDINEQGELVDITDLRDTSGKKPIPSRMVLPALGKSRTSIESNFLWDGPGYVLGRDDKGKPERTVKCSKAFLKLHERLLGEPDIPEARALLNFLRRSWADHPKVEERWKDIATANLVFRVGQRFLHDLPVLKEVWTRHVQGDDSRREGVCLVTGEHMAIANLHPSIRGVVGAQPSGAALCSYNLSAFGSFGKTQNQNGPIGSSVAFAYTTALNYLIRQEGQKLRLGAATVVCWAEKPTPLEDALFSLFAGANADVGKAAEVDRVSAKERADVLRKLGQGLPVTRAWPEVDPSVQIHVLALAPNAARLSVSFYLQGSAQTFLDHARQYYSDLAIVRRFDNEPEFPSVWQIARAVLGPHKKATDIKRLGEDLLRAALSNQSYPSYLLPMCLQRLRSGDRFDSVRAGLIKAMLIRNHQQEVSMSLNQNHPSVAYQLGRLFALLVGVQHKAIGPKINADIRDKYYGSASATPALVFSLLLRNAQNHISKAKAYGYDKLIRDILERIDSFPDHLNLKDQGLFALGYYHQRAEKAVKAEEESLESNSDTDQQ